MQVVGMVDFNDEPVEYNALSVSRDGSVAKVENAVQAESLLSVHVNGVLAMKLACSASNLAELVVGRLYTEHMIDSVDEIDSLLIHERDMRIDVRLRSSARRGSQVEVGAPARVAMDVVGAALTCSEAPEGTPEAMSTRGGAAVGTVGIALTHGGAVAGAAREAQACGGTSAGAVETIPTCSSKNALLDRSFVREAPLEPVSPIPWTPAQVFRICDEFALDKTAHSRTRGAHSAYLCTLDETLCVREDIGRHNAFDKAIGWALMNGVDLSRCLMYTSGRVPTDMVVKAISARLPILVSKAVATDKTVELARRYDLTLICEGKGGSFIILNDPCGAFTATQVSA